MDGWIDGWIDWRREREERERLMGGGRVSRSPGWPQTLLRMTSN